MLDYLIEFTGDYFGRTLLLQHIFQGVNAQDAVNNCRKEHGNDVGFVIHRVLEDSGSDWVPTWEEWS